MGRKRYTYEDIKLIVEEKGYKLLSSKEEIEKNGIVSVRTKILVKCKNEKHHPYWIRIDSFKDNNSKCKQCINNESRTPYQEVKEYFMLFNYILLSEEYINNSTKLDVLCPNGHKWNVSYTKFKDRGQRCPMCNNSSHSYEYVKQYINNYNYKLLSDEYKNIFKPLDVECPNGHVYSTTFHRFKNQNCRCPICKVTKGEQRIMNWLNKNNIEYIYNKEYFDDLLSPLGNPLKPDFIIEDEKIWIEYDGEFHYKEYFESQHFKTLQIHDEIKNKYAKENNWKLIRIPYWDFDRIEEILDKEIKN